MKPRSFHWPLGTGRSRSLSLSLSRWLPRFSRFLSHALGKFTRISNIQVYYVILEQ